MGTKWVQIGPISMILGPECVFFHKDSESDLKMARFRPKKPKNKQNKFQNVFAHFGAFLAGTDPFGGQIRNPREKLHNPVQKSSKSELSGPISCPFFARVNLFQFGLLNWWGQILPPGWIGGEGRGEEV